MAIVSAAAFVALTAQDVMAHTGIRDVVQEGVTTYNALNISHGCASNEIPEGQPANRLDLIASSAVFPNNPDPTMAVVTKLDPVSGAILETVDPAVGLSNDIVGSVAGKGFTNLGLGLVQPNLFPNFLAKVGTDGTATINRGFASHNGPRPFASAPIAQSVSSSSSLAPFRTAPISFKTTSCAKSLRVRVAAANWCLRGAVSDKNPARVDIWIGHMTTKFNDSLVMPYSQADMDLGKVHWPTMTVNRNLTTNPLPVECGAGYNLAIEPSDADIDANLPIPVGVAPTGARQQYWPSL